MRPSADLHLSTPAGSRVTIDPAAVVRNWQRLAARTGAECGAVVKADAYGHGAAVVAPALAEAGCRTFFVALAGEGVALRRVLPEATIYVLNGLFDAALARAHALRPFVSSLDALAEWPADLPFALNVDTGMNRLGVTVAEAAAVTRAPVLIASHFAAADTPDHPLNQRQEAAFAAARAAHPKVPASFANSARDPVAPGRALRPRPPGDRDVRRQGGRGRRPARADGAARGAGDPAARGRRRRDRRLRRRRDADPRQPHRHRLARLCRRLPARRRRLRPHRRRPGLRQRRPGPPRRPRLDGPPRGRRHPRPCRRGDLVELFGPNVPLDTVARHAGTIGYELLTGLSRRAERRAGPLAR